LHKNSTYSGDYIHPHSSAGATACIFVFRHDHIAHYHILNFKVGGFISDLAFGSLQRMDLWGRGEYGELMLKTVK
jgi:hypothetical protein